jgi:uncharacterized repeat protein (TIGR03803 family)
MVPSNGGSTWTEVTHLRLYRGADGGDPVAGLVIGTSNVMYGTTYSGGAHGYGTVFQVAPSKAGVWTQKVLYSFAGGSDGAYPAAGLTLNSSGVLYGTTIRWRNSAGFGTVFELIPSQTSGWSEKVIYTFLGGTDGMNPLANLSLASNGSLYGTTYQGGQFTVTNDPGTIAPRRHRASWTPGAQSSS